MRVGIYLPAEGIRCLHNRLAIWEDEVVKISTQLFEYPSEAPSMADAVKERKKNYEQKNRDHPEEKLPL